MRCSGTTSKCENCDNIGLLKGNVAVLGKVCMRRTQRVLAACLLSGVAAAVTLPAQAGLLAKMFEEKSSEPATLPPDPVAAAPNWVTLEGGDKLAGKKRFALVGFTLEFQVQAQDYSSQFGSTVASKSSMTMEGVTTADMQAITDQVYGQFIKTMGEQGIALSTPNDLATSAAWKTVAGMAKGQTYEMSAEKDKVVLVAPTGHPVIATHPDEETKRLRWGLSGLKAMSSGTLPQAEIALAKELGYPVMKVYYVVRFGSAKAVAINGSSQAKATVSGLILGDRQSGISIRSENDNPLPDPFGTGNAKQDGDSFVRLKNSISSSQSILAGDVYKQGGVDNALGTALTILTGAGTFQHNFVAPLDPKLYSAFATDTLNGVSRMLAAQLKGATGN